MNDFAYFNEESVLYSYIENNPDDEDVGTFKQLLDLEIWMELGPELFEPIAFLNIGLAVHAGRLELTRRAYNENLPNAGKAIRYSKLVTAYTQGLPT